MPASTARPRRIAIVLLFACVVPAFGAFGIALLFVAMSSGAALSTPNFAQVLIWLGYLFGAAPAALTGVLYGFASSALQRVWLSPLYGGAVTFMLSSVWHTPADAVVLLSLAGAYAAHLAALAVRLTGLGSFQRSWSHGRRGLGGNVTMADVFVSYKKSDADRVRPLVETLRAAGLDVWWDEGIQPSTSWRAEIAKQIAAAKCVIAVWTQDSVDPEQGQWVMEEATHGLARKILAPVRLDLVAPPLGFGEVQYADLAAWSGGADDPRFQHFLGIVQAIVRSEPIPQAPRPTHFEAPGIKLQGVRMENVTIQVGDRGAPNRVETPAGGSLPVGGGADDEDEEEAPRTSRSTREKTPFSPSLFMAQAVGVIFPLVAIVIFIFSMGGMACDAGNAPAFFCDALDAMRGSPSDKP